MADYKGESMIKHKIKKTRFGEALTAFKRVYHSEKYRQWFRDYLDCHNIFKIYDNGAMNDGKVLFVINDFNMSSGFFFTWCETCRGLMVAERLGFTPVVDWSKGAYFVPNGVNGCMNPFEYFFEPISSITLDEIANSRNVAYYNYHTFLEPFELYSYRSEEELTLFAETSRKYFKIKNKLFSQLEQEIHQLLTDKKTLAVHVRGVEWGNIKDHPIPVSLNLYTNFVDIAIKENGFEQIFLATDSDDTVSFFKERYNNLVVCYDDVIRAKSGSKVLAILDESIDAENKGFRMGCEVLRDMLTISSCEGIIAGLSYVSFAAEVFKKSRDEVYEYKKYIDMKISKKGMAPIDFAKKIKGK